MDQPTPVKVLIIGPQRCGKTRISNFLADFDESPNFETYNATAGVRILEFERQVKASNGRQMKMSVEMWDCSGDKKYENCWGAILRQAQGVVMVYDPSIKTRSDPGSGKHPAPWSASPSATARSPRRRAP